MKPNGPGAVKSGDERQTPEPTVKSRTDRTTVSWTGSDQAIEVLRATHVQQKFPPHVHATYAIGVVTAGAARTNFRGKFYDYAPGAIIAIAPQEVHTGEPLSAAGWAYRMFYLPPSLVEGLASPSAGHSESSPRLDSPVISDPELAGLLLTAHRVLELGHDSLRAESVLCHALGLLLQRHAHAANRDEAGNDSHGAQRAKEYIDGNYGVRITLQDLATVAAMSVFQLIRAFRRTFGTSPYVYAESVRVEYARTLLQQGETITAAAYRSGFSDQSHMTRHFKRLVGVTPGQYSRRTTSSDRASPRSGVRRFASVAWTLDLASSRSHAGSDRAAAPPRPATEIGRPRSRHLALQAAAAD